MEKYLIALGFIVFFIFIIIIFVLVKKNSSLKKSNANLQNNVEKWGTAFTKERNKNQKSKKWPQYMDYIVGVEILSPAM